MEQKVDDYMKFRYKLNVAIISSFIVLFFSLIILAVACISNEIIIWIITIGLFISSAIPFLFLKSILIINEEGIHIIKNSRKNFFYNWNQIKYYCDSCINRMSVIKVTLKDDTYIYLECRKKIKSAIKKYCNDIPDYTDIAKDGRLERYNNYTDKFIDLYDCEFQTVQSNSEICVFCNKRTNKLDNECLCTKKRNNNYYICSKCFNDFQKYYHFKKR